MGHPFDVDRATFGGLVQAIIEEAIARSFLAEVDDAVVQAIRGRAVIHHHRTGDLIVSEAEAGWTGIVLSGMARVFLTTSSARQVTLRHARPGTSIGIGSLLDGGKVSAQAVTESDILSLDTNQVARLARENASLAYAIAYETSVRLMETYREVVMREQGSVRQRLARQILSLAGAVGDPDLPIELPISHEELAEAVGSAREVVSRHLGRFRDEDLVALERGRIRVLDPKRLDNAARQGE